MKALLQRVGAARVEVGGEIVGSIDRGLLVLVGVEPEDGERCAAKMLHKLLNYRVFGDDEGKMNRSLLDAGRLAAGLAIHPGGEHPQRTASELSSARRRRKERRCSSTW